MFKIFGVCEFESTFSPIFFRGQFTLNGYEDFWFRGYVFVWKIRERQRSKGFGSGWPQTQFNLQTCRLFQIERFTPLRSHWRWTTFFLLFLSCRLKNLGGTSHHRMDDQTPPRHSRPEAANFQPTPDHPCRACCRRYTPGSSKPPTTQQRAQKLFRSM